MKDISTMPYKKLLDEYKKEPPNSSRFQYLDLELRARLALAEYVSMEYEDIAVVGIPRVFEMSTAYEKLIDFYTSKTILSTAESDAADDLLLQVEYWRGFINRVKEERDEQYDR